MSEIASVPPAADPEYFTAVDALVEGNTNRAHKGKQVVALASDGVFLYTAAGVVHQGLERSYDIVDWDLRSRRQVADRRDRLESAPTMLSVSPDGRWLLVATAGGTVQVWPTLRAPPPR